MLLPPAGRSLLRASSPLVVVAAAAAAAAAGLSPTHQTPSAPPPRHARQHRPTAAWPTNDSCAEAEAFISGIDLYCVTFSKNGAGKWEIPEVRTLLPRLAVGRDAGRDE